MYFHRFEPIISQVICIYPKNTHTLVTGILGFHGVFEMRAF